jgi:hypothetical protein
MPPLIIPRNIAEALNFDIAAAVEEHKGATERHSRTVNVAAPVAHPLVDMIVKQHGGEFTVDHSHAEPPRMPEATVIELIEVFIEEGIIPPGKANKLRKRFGGELAAEPPPGPAKAASETSHGQDGTRASRKNSRLRSKGRNRSG